MLLWTVDAVQAGGISTATWLAASFLPFYVHVYIHVWFVYFDHVSCFSNMTQCEVPLRFLLTAMQPLSSLMLDL